MLTRHLTMVIFVACLVLSLASLGILVAAGVPGLIAVVISVALNVGAIIISERRGFVRTTQLRRAFEPARNFNSAQVGLIVLVVMAQITAGLFVLISG
jgi:hypothetical protein